jgi:outer membrane protein TolC
LSRQQIKIYIAIVVFFCANYQASAREFTLQDSIDLGLKNSALLNKSESEKNEASSLFSKYKGGLFPEISLRGSAETSKNSANMSNAGATSELNSTKTYTAAVDVVQPLYTGGKLLGGLRLGHALEDGAEQRYYTTRQTVVRQIIDAFYTLAEAQDTLVAAKENLQILESYEKITSRYEKIGRSRDIDGIQSVINLSLGKIDVQDSEQKRLAAEINLKKLLNVEAEKEIQPKFNISVQPLAKMSIDEALQTAEKNNPEIRAVRLKLDEVRAQNQVELSTDLPSLSLTGSAGYKSPDQAEVFDDNSEFYTVGVTLKVPLFSGLSSLAKRREYKENYYQAERDLQIKLQDTREKMDVSLNDAYKLYNQLLDVQVIVKRSRRGLDLANSGYKKGIVSSTDIVQFQRSRYEAEKLFIKTQYNYLRSVLNVRELLGTNLERAYAQK